MEEQILPIVPGKGKYAGKPVTELIADKWYVDNVLKKEENKTWFNPNNKNWAPIYNIIVNQTISTNKDGNTPEHNKLQNLFLDKINQQKLLSKIFNHDLTCAINFCADPNIIRCFGKNIIPELFNKLDKTTIKFEDKFNWDLVIYYRDTEVISFTSNLETELVDKIKYKEQYDIKEKEKYNNNLLLIESLIEYRIKLDQEYINKYEENMKEYLDEFKKYENDLKNYLQEIPQNEKNIETYKNKLNIYETMRTNKIAQQTYIICQELGINYDNFKKWNSRLDKDTNHTTEEKKQLQEIVDDKLKPFIKQFEKINIIPTFVEKLKIPRKPYLPQNNNCNFKTFYISEKDGDVYKLIKTCEENKYMGNFTCNLDNTYTLNKYKKKYENDYITNYENDYITHYDNYRERYYKDLIKKYCNKNVFVEKTNENQYEISISICDFNTYDVCCELKPILSDDYPCVLRKMKAQIELTRKDKKTFGKVDNEKYILIIGSFTSIHVSNEQLITIFNQSNIKVVFTDEIFETSKLSAFKYVNTTTDQVLSENKFLTDNLLQTQQKLLQAEEKIMRLEEEIISLKTQKQGKSIKDYFGKK